jgi:hypothetical protein
MHIAATNYGGGGVAGMNGEMTTCHSGLPIRELATLRGICIRKRINAYGVYLESCD